MVLRLFPQVMQMILKYYSTPPWLKRKYLQQAFHFVLMENEIVLMDMLPKMDEFTIELCYKILRSENMLDEPKSKWGNVPHDTEIEIADDIQRIINTTNSIISINIEDVTPSYFEKLLQEIKLIVIRIDSFLEQGTLIRKYNLLSRHGTDSTSIRQDLTRVKAMEVAEFLPDSESEKQEMYSRLSMVIIETFPKILRRVMRLRCPSTSKLYQTCEPFLQEFYPDQRKSLKELQSSKSYDSLDITLIYKLLRQFSLIPPPTRNWGFFPDQQDTKLGDDIERIRYYRNQFVHGRDTNIDKMEFDDYFNKFRDIGHRMDYIVFHNPIYEMQIIGHKTCRMDKKLQTKYENAMKEIENIKLRFENKPIKFYWGDSFDRCLINLRSMLKDEQVGGRQKTSVQIIFQNEDDIETSIDILNSLQEEINKGLSGIQFVVATKGSIVLNVDILLERLETDEKLQTTLDLFMKKMLDRTKTSKNATIDVVLLPAEEFTQWKKPQTTSLREQFYLYFDVEAGFFETDEKMAEQLRKISDTICKHSSVQGGNNISATLLPISLGYEEEAFTYNQTFEGYMEFNEVFTYTQTPEENIPTTEGAFASAQAPVNYNLPVPVTLRKRLDIKQSANEHHSIHSCVKIDNTLVFANGQVNQLIICNSESTAIHHMHLSYEPSYITMVDSDVVAVSCINDKTILIIDISTLSVIRKIKTSGYCYGISYSDNNMYVVIAMSIIHVMDLTGKVIRTLRLPSNDIDYITVDGNRFVCMNETSIYCCSLDKTLFWNFKNDKYQDFSGMTTDNEMNVYVTNYVTNTVVAVYGDEQHFREILTQSDGLDRPWGIYFDKKENCLLVSNYDNGKAFLFDVKKKLLNEQENILSDK